MVGTLVVIRIVLENPSSSGGSPACQIQTFQQISTEHVSVALLFLHQEGF